MLSKLKPFPKYKESGLLWLGKMPEHWGLIPNRAIIRRRKVLVGNRHKNYQLLSLTKLGVIVRDVASGKGKFSSDMGTSQEVRKGDIVFCLFDVPETPRTVGLSSHSGMITGAYTVFECLNQKLSQYFELFYRAMDDRKLLSPLYSGLRHTIPPGRFLGTKTPQPPLDEQDVIVRFLDHANGRIERAIRAKQKLMALLNEQKQAIIHRAVTRGLNPNVPLKPTGIPWLGDIPKHWEVRRLKTLFKNVNEQTNAKRQNEIYVALEHVQSWTGCFLLPEEETKFDSQVKRFRQNDVLFGKLRPYLAKVARPQFDGICVGEFLVLRPIQTKVLPSFIEIKLRSKQLIDLINTSTAGARMPRADWAFVGSIAIAHPPDELEQEAIVDHTLKQTQALQTVITRTEREIGLLREYLVRLVAGVVTGQFDVRGVRIPDIAETELEKSIEITGNEAIEDESADEIINKINEN